eukprot:5667625-Lingulodinium_polyedra.AAC.1
MRNSGKQRPWPRRWPKLRDALETRSLQEGPVRLGVDTAGQELPRPSGLVGIRGHVPETVVVEE